MNHIFFFLSNSHGVTAYGLLVKHENTMQSTDKAAFFLRKQEKRTKKKDTHPHPPTHIHKITDAADKMKSS